MFAEYAVPVHADAPPIMDLPSRASPDRARAFLYSAVG
jgi:hypothetical protein